MLTDSIKQFRTKLSRSHTNGIFCKSTDPAFTEAAANSGLDFAILDMEHGPAGFKEVENLVRSFSGHSCLPIVRTSGSEPWMISRALDTGAAGVQVPNISSLEQARSAIESARFYPAGKRGVCRFVRAADYGKMDRNEYFSGSNENLLILMVEGKEGIEQVEEILDLEGFDILFIGPYDLSQSLGIPGEINHPLIEERLQSISRSALVKNKVVGTFYDEPSRKKWLLNCGIRYLSYSVDTEIFRRACSEIIDQ